MTRKERIELLEAYARGKKIETKEDAAKIAAEWLNARAKSEFDKLMVKADVPWNEGMSDEQE